MAKAGRVRIGVSGWRYGGWRGVFYPDGLRQKDELSYLARQFPTVEINGTFYSLQRPAFFEAWSAQTPADFVFAVKGSRYITHMLRLTKPEKPLANFFASGLLALGPKLGPILWQFPPNFRFNPDKLEAFFAQLPRDTEQAARLARRHDARVKGRAFLKPGPKRALRHAVEIRHDSFVTPDFITLLRRHRVGLVVADTVDWPLLMDVTSDFVYPGFLTHIDGLALCCSFMSPIKGLRVGSRRNGGRVAKQTVFCVVETRFPYRLDFRLKSGTFAPDHQKGMRSPGYCRLHGSEELYASGYDDASLEVWADRVAAWAKGGEDATVTRVIDQPAPKRASRDVFIYFDNDKKVRAPFDAHSLIAKVNRRLRR